MDIQGQVNIMAKALRIAVIKHLLLTDLYRFNASKSVDDAEIEWRANEINRLEISTGNMKSLFEDCHEYVREIGQFDGPVKIADLEFCARKRAVGYVCSNRFPLNWLPRKKDTELRALPEFRAIASLYMTNGGQAIPPKETKGENEKFIHQLVQIAGVTHEL